MHSLNGLITKGEIQLNGLLLMPYHLLINCYFLKSKHTSNIRERILYTQSKQTFCYTTTKILVLIVYYRTVHSTGLPACRDHIVRNNRFAWVRRELDRKGSLQCRARVEFPYCAPWLLHRGPDARASLHQADSWEISVARFVLNHHREVIRVRAWVHVERNISSLVVALDAVSKLSEMEIMISVLSLYQEIHHYYLSEMV